MTDQNNAAQPEPHPLPWSALPADKADLFEGADMWFFNDANGEEVFYGCAMSIAVRDLILEAVNRPALLSKLRAPVADERMQEALEDFEGQYLTDGNGYAPASTYQACGDAFKKHWPDRDAAFAAAKAEYDRLHRAPQASAPVAGEATKPRPPMLRIAGVSEDVLRRAATRNFTPPFGNCSFRMCDLPGQCRGEGKCHHPSDAAPQASEADPLQEAADWLMRAFEPPLNASDLARKLVIGYNRATRLRDAALSAQPGAQKGDSNG